MALKKFRPTSPGVRFRISSDNSEITASRPEKSLIAPIHKSGGRNNQGKMTMRYTGGGHKRKYRMIDFKRDKVNIPAKVASIEYDPNRTARIALLVYADGEKRYILAPQGISVGQTLLSGAGVPPEIGNSLPMANIPLGSVIHNIETRPGQGGKLARSAGASAQLVAREGLYVTVKMPSGEMRMFLAAGFATIGTLSNADHMNTVLGKAGRARHLGIRPRTRPVAMNPVDHPMGGGEGRASGGHPRSRKGLYAKGGKTRNTKKHSQSLIVERRKK
jgi:large subunit ribosomal protein L2